MSDGRLFAFGSVVFNGGVPSWVFQNGAFSNTIADTGTGDISLNMADGYAVDSAQCSVLITARAAQAASGLTTFGVVHTSDIAKQVTCVQEAAMGAASVRADVNFDVAIAKLELV